MLKIEGAEISRIAIPFRFAFRHSKAERDVGEGVLLRLRAEDGRCGYGECAPRDYVSGETSQSVVGELSRRLPAMLGRSFSSFDELAAELARQAADLPRAAHAAFCALELASLDLAGRVFERSAGELLGPVCTQSVTYSGIVSASGKKGALETCATMKQLGVTQVKVKVGGALAEDIEVLEAVREAMGAAVSVRVDANGACDAETALGRLRELERFRLDGFEQPCAADDVDGLSWLTARSRVPVIVDESLVSLEDAQRLARHRACHMFNVRISKCGGLSTSARIRELARDAGIDTMLGAHVGETAILAAAGRQFAARTPELRFAEGSYGKILLEADVSDAMDLERGGRGTVVAGHGLGIDVDLERIRGHVVERSELRGGTRRTLRSES